MLHRIDERDLEAAARVLARAMIGYPVFTYLVSDQSPGSNGPSPSRGRETLREERLCQVLRFILKVAAIQGQVVAPSRDLEAIATWIRSDRMHLSAIEAWRAGFLSLPFKVGLGTTRRLLDLAKRKHARRRELLTQPYYCLDLMGVEPRLQGKGHGRLLIETKLRQADRERTQCYLETSDQRNVGYYQRYGFEQIDQYRIEALPVYCLLRRLPYDGLTKPKTL